MLRSLFSRQISSMWWNYVIILAKTHYLIRTHWESDERIRHHSGQTIFRKIWSDVQVRSPTLVTLGLQDNFTSLSIDSNRLVFCCATIFSQAKLNDTFWYFESSGHMIVTTQWCSLLTTSAANGGKPEQSVEKWAPGTSESRKLPTTVIHVLCC